MNPDSTQPERRVVVSPAYSPQARTALVSMRVDGSEVLTTPKEARRIAQELMEASFHAEDDTVLVDFLVHKTKMQETEARGMLAEMRQHRETLARNKII